MATSKRGKPRNKSRSKSRKPIPAKPGGDNAAGVKRRGVASEQDAASVPSTAPAETAETPNADQIRFVDEFLIDRNATRAYLKVYPEVTPGSARVLACRLLTKVHIAALVDEKEAELAAAVGLTQHRIKEELAVLSFSDIKNYVIDDNGHVELAENAPDGAIRAVQSLKRKRRVIQREDEEDIVEIETEIKLWDKPGSLRMAGQHLKMFTEKHEHEAGGSLLEAIVGASQRAAT